MFITANQFKLAIERYEWNKLQGMQLCGLVWY